MSSQLEYERSREILRKAALSAAHVYKFRHDDALAEANYIYVCAQRDYRPGRTTFVRFLRHRLRCRLVDAPRLAHNRELLLPRESLGDVHADPGETLANLSEAALRVVRLAVSSRPNLKPRTIRRMLREYLSELGWTSRQILDCFSEIKEALQ